MSTRSRGFGRPEFQWPALRVEQVSSAFSGTVGANRWSNKDLDPIRREDRKWSI
ncbi:hypothetical protein N7G274_010357 [Stereocaulon virgatum]|uniref:Uncharacterized protein n=1 Tax=Stereocaulon virgatum TaxID=373712 RepID=A0ABR3ZXY0_9LECA